MEQDFLDHEIQALEFEIADLIRKLTGKRLQADARKIIKEHFLSIDQGEPE